VVTTADGLLRLQQALEAKSAVLPVVDGSIPPVFLQNSDGSLIYTPV
jgi:hypothetical protein